MEGDLGPRQGPKEVGGKRRKGKFGFQTCKLKTGSFGDNMVVVRTQAVAREERRKTQLSDGKETEGKLTDTWAPTGPLLGARPLSSFSLRTHTEGEETGIWHNGIHFFKKAWSTHSVPTAVQEAVTCSKETWT